MPTVQLAVRYIYSATINLTRSLQLVWNNINLVSINHNCDELYLKNIYMGFSFLVVWRNGD